MGLSILTENMQSLKGKKLYKEVLQILPKKIYYPLYPIKFIFKDLFSN